MENFPPFASDPERVFSQKRTQPDLSSALIFLDTNVLLAPYRASSEALDAIVKTYEVLKKQERLVVPGEVAREFARNRPLVLTQLHKAVSDAKSIGINGGFDAIPILARTPEFERAQVQFKLATTALKTFRAEIEKLVARIASWQHDDPVLATYRSLFDPSNVKDLSISAAELDDLRKRRYQARVPPGFRDAGKGDGGGGDLAMWLTILDTAQASGRDAVLVTEEGKDDWFHRSGEHKLFPRYELLEEFAERTKGKSFGILSLADLLKVHGATPAVVEEVRQQELTAPTDFALTATVLFRLARDRLFAVVQREGGALVQSAGFPDFEIDTSRGTFGMEVVPILPGSFRTVNSVLRKAINVRSNGAFKELAVVFLGLASAARALDDRLAEERDFGPGVSVVICEVLDDVIRRVLRNDASEVIFKAAFPIGDQTDHVGSAASIA